MTTDVEICSQALTQLGAGTISSFDDGSYEASICERVYGAQRAVWFSHDWYFAHKRAVLSRSNTPPLMEWSYNYILPSDFEALDSVFTSNQVGGTNYHRYELEGGFLQTNAEEIYIRYRFVESEGKWPSWFVAFAITAMAAELAIPITENRTLRTEKRIEAWGRPPEQKAGGLWQEALFCDHKARPSPSIASHNAPLTGARFGGW